jgi:peptidoglycan/LPS O-acetylase OafA/YrhL
MPLVDVLKAAASQLIVLHHLAAYGPMSEVVYEHAPGLFDWLYYNARMAVQIFLVVGGFLATRTLAPHGVAAIASPGVLLWRRYCRLALPLFAAILLSIGSAAVARAWMEHDFVPAAPSLAQFAAHTLLLHDILGHEALSAGVWYVAIDFQLFGLLVASLWLARELSGALTAVWGAPLLILLLAVASLFYFNRDPDWDAWALYFFAAYALGTLAYWAGNRTHSPLWLTALAAFALVAVVVDFRPRLLVALAAALALGIACRTQLLERWPAASWVSFLARISYSVFLVHFPVCMLINAAVFRFFQADLTANVLGLLIAWSASIGAGWLLYYLVERRTDRLVAARHLRTRTAVASS